jgi:hypothetical protein
MPEFSGAIQTKITALLALPAAQRKPLELVAIHWPEPTGVKLYASAAYDELPWWPDLADAILAEFGEAIPLTVRLIPDRSPFNDLPRVASVSDDSVNLAFSDLDDEFSDALMAHGEGIRVEVYGYWPAVDLLLSMWRGLLHAPKDMDRAQVKVQATAGFRAPQMLVPRRPHATSCPFIFGALLDTQEEIDFHKGCPYNDHIGGSIGVPGFTDCPRMTKAQCVERLGTENFWPGFETRPDPIPNNQTKGPNLSARAYGNESNLNDPIRAVFGERHIKALNLLAFRNETNTNHPDEGFGAGLFAVSEGPLLAMWEFRMNGGLVPVGDEHQQQRRGELGQVPTDWSPDVNSYSGTAHIWGRVQGNYDEATSADYSASVRALGLRDLRVYSDEDTYVEGYTTNRMWALLELLANARWGYGQDYPRYDIPSAIETAAWCDEQITLTDPNGNAFSGVRSTFNAELTARAIQQQIKDLCTAGRIGIPFEFQGKDVFVPLRAEDTDDPDIPSFSDEGANRNIIFDGEDSPKSTLQWSYISDDALPNQWTVNFDDADNAHVDTQVIFGDQPQQLRAGRAWGDRSKRVINKSQSAFGVTNFDEAARLGLSLLYLGPLDSGGILNPWSVKFSTWYTHAFQVQNYKLIRVQNAKLQSRIAAYFTARGLEPYPDADYTYFRVMKYTRKGDLRVDIEAQLYATLEEAPYDPELEECEAEVVGYTPPVSSSTITSHALTEVGDYLVARLYFEEAGRDPSTTNFNTPAQHMNPTGWTLISVSATTRVGDGTGVFWHMVYHRVASVAGELAYDFGVPGPYSNVWGDMVAVREQNADLGLAFYDERAAQIDEAASNTLTPAAPADADVDGHLVLLFTASDLPVTAVTPAGYTELGDEGGRAVFARTGIPAGPVAAPSVVLSANSSADLYLLMIKPCGAGAGGSADFSAPRDFTATVNALTGVVHFTWAPPAVHPELVTGYTMYEADGVTVAMPTALVYEHEITLAPGTYVYKVRATDGVDVSAFATVAFTVPEVPSEGGDLDVIDDLTLESVFDDLTLLAVTG